MTGPRRLVIEAKTADYTIKDGDSGKVFTTRGATGAVVFTLPAQSAVASGFYVDVCTLADEDVTVQTATADTLVAKNDLTADSVAQTTTAHQIGNYLRFIADGTGWITVYMLAPSADGLAVSAHTIATA